MIFIALTTLTLASITLATDIVIHLKADIATPSDAANQVIGHDLNIIAAGGWFWLNYPNNATCDKYIDYAQFWSQGDALNLYNYENDPLQQLWVDRSTIGQGAMGYSTGNESLPAGAEITGWTIGGGNLLQFNGSNYYACPSMNKAYALWVNVGTATPGNQQGCFSVALRAYTDESPIRCRYTSREFLSA